MRKGIKEVRVVMKRCFQQSLLKSPFTSISLPPSLSLKIQDSRLKLLYRHGKHTLLRRTKWNKIQSNSNGTKSNLHLALSSLAGSTQAGLLSKGARCSHCFCSPFVLFDLFPHFASLSYPFRVHPSHTHTHTHTQLPLLPSCHQWQLFSFRSQDVCAVYEAAMTGSMAQIMRKLNAFMQPSNTAHTWDRDRNSTVFDSDLCIDILIRPLSSYFSGLYASLTRSSMCNAHAHAQCFFAQFVLHLYVNSCPESYTQTHMFTSTHKLTPACMHTYTHTKCIFLSDRTDVTNMD